MARQAAAEKRQRRERGSINPEDIIKGAFELAEDVSVDNLSMPLLGKHLGVGVTSIYWYFRKKDDLLNAMADRALRQIAFEAPYVDAANWRESLHNHAHNMRKTFLASPILCDLVLIRGALSAKALRLGLEQIEAAVSGLVGAGLSPEDAFDTYSAVSVHVRGSVVLARLYEKTRSLESSEFRLDDSSTVDPETTPLMAELSGKGHHVGVPNDMNFEYGLNCILDHAARLIDEGAKPAKKAAARRKSTASR
ncbi:TetR family transcriptional regulator [Mycobacterium sp. IS-1496]|uniref:TetR/AcrR family transcriptional regulator n=1 Tax=Mycobacterium sp. IS-1496 TaxID=1772284 RepID=UPI000741796C|nr:TetR/AcrR family transcriptional regulator [Mycobacterium sp. IS-1496]KUI22046.1 TetR family transcriptional regulator [Mycobacterium sp. IS-1496]